MPETGNQFPAIQLPLGAQSPAIQCFRHGSPFAFCPDALIVDFVFLQFEV